MGLYLWAGIEIATYLSLSLLKCTSVPIVPLLALVVDPVCMLVCFSLAVRDGKPVC